ncbi:MAG TPA: dienelactone hydrolase family protein [Acidimicrobiales bacterium]
MRTTLTRPGAPVRRALAGLVLACTFVGASVTAAPTTAAAETEYRRGPDPTEASITAPLGSFATASTTVPDVAGFGGGVIHYPTDTSQGTFGAVAIAPGFLGSSANYGWLGPRLASQGFVVFLINTDSRLDQPPSRGAQLLAALDYLVTTSSVRNRVDASRLAVAGHSMGGGGTLQAAASRPSLQAAIPFQPWHTDKTWPEVQVPTLIVGSENDTTAPVANHAEPFYTSLPGTIEKAYLELNNADHRVGTQGNTTMAKFMIAWLKRYVDNDTRYEQFICPPPAAGGAIEEYRHTCPG